MFDEPKGRRKPPRHLADLTADERADLADELGLPALPGAAAVDPLLLATGRRARPDDRPPGGRARGAGRGAPASADDAAAHDGGRPRDHPKDPLAAVRRRPGRVGADALPRPRHHVRLEPGRLRYGVPVLRDRSGRPAAQHVDRRDRRAGRGRSAGAGTRRGRRRSRSCLQRRLHGHGGADGQLSGRHGRRTPAHRPRPRRPRHVGPGRDGLDRRAGPTNPAAHRGGHPGHPRPVPPRARRRAAQRAGADQHPLLRGRERRGGVGLRAGDPSAGSRSSTP